MAVNTERIARNTLVLYLRMLLVLLVKLYSSRILLIALGVEDFGIFNVVSGIILLLSFLKWVLRGADQRYLNMEMGLGNETGMHRVFSASVKFHFLVCIGILILAETLGLWFLNARMNIPVDRMPAANWVYQLSVIAFLFDFFTTPHEAAVIAHEKMGTFSLVDILGTLLSLGVVVLLMHVKADRLIVYACLFFSINFLLRFIYVGYCGRHFAECRGGLKLPDPEMVRELAGFTFWTIPGHLGYSLHTKGIPVLVNLSFGVLVNAALGITFQVYGVVRAVAESFLTALKPQIVTCYAEGDRETLFRLVSRGCRAAFCLTLVIVVPLVLETPAILDLWLETVPEYTVLFVRIILLTLLIDSYSILMETTNAATGDLKPYGLSILIISILHLALAHWLFVRGYGPAWALYSYMIAIAVEQTTRTLLVCRSIGMPVSRFLREVFGRAFLAGVPAFLLAGSVQHWTGSTLWTLAAGVAGSACCSFFLAFNPSEREGLLRVVKKLLPR